MYEFRGYECTDRLCIFIESGILFMFQNIFSVFLSLSPFLIYIFSNSDILSPLVYTSEYIVCITICQGRSGPFYIVTYYLKWVTTYWTHSINWIKITFQHLLTCINQHIGYLHRTSPLYSSRSIV